MKEYLDVIDKKDKIIYQEDRKKIHKQGLLHREIHVWFFDTNQKIIFQKRGINKSSGGLLDATVGGHVDAGETYKKAAIREILEEIGVNIKNNNLKKIKKLHLKAEVDQNTKINNVYRTIYVYKENIDLKKIKKEPRVIGVNFKAISVNNLQKYKKIFDTHILEKEIPLLLKSML